MTNLDRLNRRWVCKQMPGVGKLTRRTLVGGKNEPSVTAKSRRQRCFQQSVFSTTAHGQNSGGQEIGPN